MRQRSKKKSSLQPAREQTTHEMGPSSGIANQAALAILEGQSTQTPPGSFPEKHSCPKL